MNAKRTERHERALRAIGNLAHDLRMGPSKLLERCGQIADAAMAGDKNAMDKLCAMAEEP